MASPGTKIVGLHWYRVKRCEIIIAETSNLHLVRPNDRICIQPLPEFLRDFTFFQANMCSKIKPPRWESTLHANACGLICSNTSLVAHHSDFRISIETGLLPPHLDWNAWSIFAAQLREGISAKDIHPRYRYGELSYVALNGILACVRRSAGTIHYHTTWRMLFRSRFRWLLAVFLYITAVLAAMQTGIAADAARSERQLYSVVYNIGVAFIIMLLGVLVFAFLVVVVNCLGWFIGGSRNQRRINSLV